MRYAIHAPNFGEPRALLDLALAAEGNGWDGFLLWDHVGSPAESPIEVLDPWVMLEAIAAPIGSVSARPSRRWPGGGPVVAAGLPEEPAAFDEAGATWWLATGWPQALRELASKPPTT